jgi:hypothetical protein
MVALSDSSGVATLNRDLVKTSRSLSVIDDTLTDSLGSSEAR